MNVLEAGTRVIDRFPERGPLPRLKIPDPSSSVASSLGRATWRTVQFSFDTFSGSRAAAFAKLSLPVTGPNYWGGLHAALDEMALVYFEIGRPNRFEDLDFGRMELEVENLIDHHDHRGVTDDPFSAHDDPPAPSSPHIVDHQLGPVAGELMTFESEWEPHPLAPGRLRWVDDELNNTVHVPMLRHKDGPRPWLLMVHGAEMGRIDIDARIMRAERLHKRLGVNIAMPILPKHGPRRPNRTVRGSFPGLEMADNVHGLSQAIWDIRRVLTWIRTQETTAIGVYGFSLGAYVTSVLAGLEPNLDALVVGCPVINLVDLFALNTPKAAKGAERLAIIYERARLAHRPISPLYFDRVLDNDRMVLMGATSDRMSDPLKQLSRLWEHWDRPQVEWIDGGHLTYLMTSTATDRLERSLRQRGVAHQRS